MAAVSIAVLGHKAFTAILYFLYSSDIPITHILIPNFAIVYAVNFSNHFGFKVIGGLMFNICGLVDFFKCFKQILEHKYVPLRLISFIKSNCFEGRVSLLNKLIALALLIKISIEPNSSITLFIENLICSSNLISVFMPIDLTPKL